MFPPKVLYLSGPISGHPDFFETFDRYERQLRERDFTIFNPAKCINSKALQEFISDEKFTYRYCLHRDINFIFHCDGIVVMPGWETSKGARLEVYVAKSVGLPIYSVESLLTSTNPPELDVSHVDFNQNVA